MKFVRIRFTLWRLMVVVMAAALLLAAVRFVVITLPHVLHCRSLALREELLSRGYRHAAAQYRNCARTVPCAATEYCYNACLDHASAPRRGFPTASEQALARSDAAHRRAIEDHERAAALHASMARRYRHAMFQPSQPLPGWTPEERMAADVFEVYRCDIY
jgi:hypothetical protein